MQVKRDTKRKFRRIISVILIICAAFIVAATIFYINKMVFPVISLDGTSDKELIRPLGESTSIEDLKRRLDDKNIIFESLTQATESGVFVGMVKEGPTVLFSQTQDAKWQVASLALILQRTTVNNKKPRLIDLTTNRPIVKF